jgi:hypothetical protein
MTFLLVKGKGFVTGGRKFHAAVEESVDAVFWQPLNARTLLIRDPP